MQTSRIAERNSIAVNRELSTHLKKLSSLFESGKISRDTKVRIDTRNAIKLLEIAKHHFSFNELRDVSITMATAASHEQSAVTEAYQKDLEDNAKSQLSAERKNEYAYCMYNRAYTKTSRLEDVILEANKNLPIDLNVDSHFDPFKLLRLPRELTPQDQGAYLLSLDQFSDPPHINPSTL